MAIQVKNFIDRLNIVVVLASTAEFSSVRFVQFPIT